MSATAELELIDRITPDPEDYAGQQGPALRHSQPPRLFAGLPVSTIVLGGITLVLLLWATWATRELLAMRSHRTVSVSLSSLVRDFIAVEARSGLPADASAARTRAYIAAIGAGVKALSDDGNTVLVSEAVLGNSVTDVTPALKAAVDAQLHLQAVRPASESAGLVPATPERPLGPSAPGSVTPSQDVSGAR